LNGQESWSQQNRQGSADLPEFQLPQFHGAAGKPLPPGTKPAAPAKPFLGKIAEMLSGILGGGLRAFGGGIKSVTGAGGAVAMSGILGMMGYAGPYGYDPFGPGQSMDPYSQSMPETNSCYQLLETWLRQCSAQPESFLEISSVTTITPGHATTQLNSTDAKSFKIHISNNGSREVGSSASSHIHQDAEIDHGAPLPDYARMHAVSLLEQVANVLNIDMSKYAPPRPTMPMLRGSRPAAPLMGGGGGSNPSPNEPATGSKPQAPEGPAPPSRPGMFDNIMSGAGMTPAVGGMVSQTLGPDTYNPWVADGAEPDEFQVSGPEKCTRLMNNWLWKCAMSPM